VCVRQVGRRRDFHTCLSTREQPFLRFPFTPSQACLVEAGGGVVEGHVVRSTTHHTAGAGEAGAAGAGVVAVCVVVSLLFHA